LVRLWVHAFFLVFVRTVFFLRFSFVADARPTSFLPLQGIVTDCLQIQRKSLLSPVFCWTDSLPLSILITVGSELHDGVSLFMTFLRLVLVLFPNDEWSAFSSRLFSTDETHPLFRARSLSFASSPEALRVLFPSHRFSFVQKLLPQATTSLSMSLLFHPLIICFSFSKS